MTIPFGGFTPTGWVCPKCGAGNSPSLTQCPCTWRKTAPMGTSTASGTYVCQHVWTVDTTGRYCVNCLARDRMGGKR